MIYRILVRAPIARFKGGVWVGREWGRTLTWGRSGAVAFAEVMNDRRLRAPKRLQNPRTTFWFTERGWEEVGKEICRQAMREGVAVKVLQRKNPKRSEVAWADAHQVALLPIQKKKE